MSESRFPKRSWNGDAVKSPEAVRSNTSVDPVVDQLNWSIRQASRSRFYRQLLRGVELRSAIDLAGLPVTTKEDLRDAYPDGMLAVGFERLVEYHESFGTTGDPVSGPITAGDAGAYVEQIQHCRIDLRSDDTVLIRFPYAISLPAHVVHAAAREAGACVVPVSSRTTVSPYPRVVKLLSRLPVTVLCGLPFEMLLIAETARQLGIDVRSMCPLRGIVVAGELLSDEKQALLEEIWDVPVHILYGATELGNLAQTCERRRLHVCGRHFHFEVCGREWRPVPTGMPGRLVASTLTKEAMPLIRYDTGDLVRLQPSETCGCGRIDPVLEILGREEDSIRFGDHCVLSGELDRAAAAYARSIGARFWYSLLEADRIRLRVDSEESGCERGEAAALISEVSEKIGVEIVIEGAPPGSLVNRSVLFDVRHVGKPRYVTDLRNPRTWDARLPDVFRVPECP